MKKITSNVFAKSVKSGDTSLVEDYAEQLGIDPATLSFIARQIRTHKNAKLTTRTHKEGWKKGYKDAIVSYDDFIWGTRERVSISWHFNRDGECYAVYNGCFCI